MLILNDSINGYSYTDYSYALFEDTKGTITIENILTDCCAFQESNDQYPVCINPGSSYWMKLDFIDNSSASNFWVFELYNNKLDHVEFYTITNGRITRVVFGDQHDFSNKKIDHKNHLIRLPTEPGKKHTIYLRAQTADRSDLHGMIRKAETFISYAVNEYMYLGIFYGFLLTISLYNLIIFLYMRSSEYCYYFFYVLFFGIYSATFDGTGFQYLWPDFPQINNYVSGTAFCFFIVFELLFAMSFNNVLQRFPKLGKVILSVIVIRILYYGVALFYYPELLSNMQIDIIPILILLIIGIYSYMDGYRLSVFFVLGVLFFLTGYIVNIFTMADILPHNLLTVYAMNYGIGLEMVAFAVCLAYRFRELKYKKEEAVTEVESKNKELEITERTRKFLERAIHERTHEILKQKDIIQRRNEDLDTFLYKSSHNLLGPIKSIEGLSMLINSDNNQELKNTYAKLILESAESMDKDLNQLRKIAEINRLEPSLTDENISLLVPQLLKEHHKFSCFAYSHSHTGTDMFNTDKTIFLDVICNTLEATLKFKGLHIPEHPSYSLHTALQTDILTIQIKIDPIKTHEIFINDLFKPFNINLKSLNNIDFELYIAKILVEKISGTIEAHLEENQLIFTILLPSATSVN
ncbi:MAG: hypothetical protein H7259_08030 [Cytophagales bacterium]|nr:hypothetical protein [Cytophaga sp.]